MTNTETFATHYRLRAYFVFGVALLILSYRFFSHALFSAMLHPVYSFGQKETWYYILLTSGLPQFVTDNYLPSLILDLSLFMFPFLFLLRWKQAWAVAFSVVVLIYFFTFNLITGHHYHGLVGVILITIPFWTKNETRFNLLWEAVRCYWLYIFASAALWKILRGSVFYTGQLSNILKSQQLDLLLQQPDSFQAQVAQYLIANPQVSHGVFVVNVLVQLCFAVGFFTKKFDTVLFVLAIVFCAANYFVMSIVSVELLILNLTLLNWEKVATLFNRQTKL
jgi:hypothetical protein